MAEYPAKEVMLREISHLRDRLEASNKDRGEALEKVEQLAVELMSIPAPHSNAFVRGTRAAGRRVKKLVRSLRMAGGSSHA